MITSADIRRILSKRQTSTPADDFRIIDSWVEYENSGSFADKSSEKRKLNYMCYELEVLNPVTGEKEHLFKALKFCRVIRLPKSAKESKTFMDMHTQVLTGVWENQINFVTVIANIMEPVALGLLFLYGVQGIGRDIQEAKEIAHNDFLSFIGSLQGTYKVLELSTLTAEESEWLREKMYGMEYLTVVRGIPKAHNQGVDVSKSSGMDGKIANPEGQGTLEEIIIGMTDYEYVIEILSTPVYTDTLKHWSQRTESDMTDWYGQLQGTKGYSFNLSIPMMYLANQSTSSGWSQAYTDAESVSYTDSETFSTAFGESAGTALSESYGTSIGHSEGISNSESVSFSSTTTTGETIGETVGTTIGESVGTTIGNSVGTSQGISNGNTVGHSVGNGTSHTVGSSLGESFGTSHSVSISNGESETHSLGTSTSWSHSTGESFGESETSSEGFSQNQSFSRGESSGTSSNASFGASENWSEGTSSGHSNGISTGSSTSNSETSSDSISTSESASQTHSDTHSNSTSVGNSVGTSHSDSQGASNTVTSGKTQGTSSGTNYSSSHTVTNGTSSTVSESHGTSHSTGASNGTSNTTGTSDSAGTSDGWSQNSGSTQSTSSSHSVGTGTSHSSGSSDGGSVSSGSSDSTGSSAGGSTGTSSSQTQSTGQSGSTSQNTSTGSSSSSVTSQGNNTSVGASAMGINVGGSTSNSASNSQGTSSSVGSGASQGSSTSTGTSEGVSSSTTATDSSSHSTTNSSSVSHTNSTTNGTSTSNSNTTGSSNSLSQTNGVSGSTNQSHSTNASSGTSQSVSASTGTSQSTSHSTGQSQSTSNGFSSGSSFTTSQSVSSSESIGASINRGDTTSETSSITNGESTGSSDGYSVTQGESKGHTTGSSIGYGTSNSSSESFSSTSSSSMGGGYSTSVGSGSSQSVTSSASEGFGSSSSTSFGKTHTTSSTDSVGGGTSESYSWGKSHTTGESNGTSQSTSTSTSVSDGTSKNYSDSFSTSTSNSSSTSQSHSESQSNSSSVAHSNSSSVAHSNSVSNGTSRGTSTGNSSSDSTSESKSHGTTESTGTSKTISNGTSKGTSKGISRGESIGTSGAYASGTASSMGLGPSIGYSKSYQWVDQQVKDIIELLEFQNQRIKKALRGEGAMYTYVYIACSSMDALSTAKATAKSAWQNEFALTNPLQVLDLTEQEQNHLLYHFSAFSSDVTRENVAGAQEYKYATVLLPGELTAYTHLPRISEGGIYANVEDIPKFAVPSMMRGEIYLGTVLSTERYSFNNGYSTPFDYKFDEASLMHGIFSGASRSGKTVAALRFAAELSRVRRKSTGKRLRLICMDPKTDWRALAHYVEPERFKFYSLGDINFHPIKLNPWKIPKGVWPQLWIDGVIDIYCRAYGLLERGKQMMGETIYALYEEAGVFKACDKEDWRETTPELSKQVTFAAIYARMSKIKLDLEDPNNKKGRAGNDTRDAYARLLDRLQAFGREFSIERRLFSSKDGMGVDDLIGEDDVVVLESSGLESTFSNFIFGVITSGFYKYAKAHEKGFLSKDQYETVFFIEEANKVLIGSDSADRSGGGNMGLSGQSEFEEILDQAAGWGLFIFAVTQLIAAMPSSVIANVGLLFAGRQGRVDDTTVVVRKIAREERIDDRDMVKWFPKAPIGWFVCQSTRGYNFKDAEPVLVKIAPLNNPSPTNDELDEILVQRKVIQAIKEAQ